MLLLVLNCYCFFESYNDSGMLPKIQLIAFRKMLSLLIDRDLPKQIYKIN